MMELQVIEYERTLAGRELIIQLFPYRPFAPFAEECGDVSAYYFISNAAYHQAKMRINALRAEGYTEADWVKCVSWKQILLALGLAVRGRNSLVYTPEFGSFFLMEIITKNGQIDAWDGVDVPMSPACENCRICRQGCPAGAIGCDLDADRCLRQYMVEGKYPDVLKRGVGKRLLGCDACQSRCPMNQKIQPLRAPEEIQDLFRLDRLLNIERDDELLRAIGGAIGTNYARKRYLLALSCIAAGNTDPERYRDQLQMLAAHEDPRVADAARFYL